MSPPLAWKFAMAASRPSSSAIVVTFTIFLLGKVQNLVEESFKSMIVGFVVMKLRRKPVGRSLVVGKERVTMSEFDS
jgi:hypothetical protein